MKIQRYRFQQHGDGRGRLTVVENNEDIPFAIRRVYYLYDTSPGFIRGLHSHKSLEQILVCVTGSCKILMDDGYSKEEVVLDDPNEGLYIGPNVWREMYDFTEGAVLLVMASELYDESDYIRNYDTFIDRVKGNNISDGSN